MDAANWFPQAIAIDKQAAHETAIEDPGLEPLWASLGGTGWEKV